ncbi:hypothetical protein GCM10009827_055710 [Dactylosporangium maewongense]|uniref:Integral membrane protein n=1 Tax=Dactylosporangium maewongense TaxID=634393 RepID=A0ABN2AZY2_9ACTN
MSAALLALVVRLLPASRRDWGRAMLAESAAIPPGRDRRSHALGCVAAVVCQPAVLRTLAYPLAAVAVLAGVLRWSAGIAYQPLRWGVVGVIALLLAVALAARALGPVAAGRTARAVRAGGCLLVAALTAAFAAAAGHHGPPDEQARTAVPIFAVLLTSYLIGFLALTAARTAVTGRALAAGVAAACAAAGVWLALQVAFPPLPTNVGGALFAIGCGVAATLLARGGALAALSVGVLAPLLVFGGVVLLSVYGPPRLIPDLVPAALTPADDLANSRIEIQDPYVAMLFLACLSALTLTAAAVTTRRPAATMAAC